MCVCVWLLCVLGVVCWVCAADVLLSLLCGCCVCCRKDERMRVLGEALYGIRVIKLFAWEDHFDKAISTSISNTHIHEAHIIHRV